MGEAERESGGLGGFLLLDPRDNILICTATAAAGSAAMIDGQVILLTQPIEVGHKIARWALAKGDQILRYGFPIGTMAEAADIGAHVHQHNLKSDYIPAHGRGGLDAEGGA